MKIISSLSSEFFEQDFIILLDSSPEAEQMTERLAEAKTSIFLDTPFFGSIIARMELFPTRSKLVPKIAINPRRILFNPIYLQKFDFGRIKMMFLHLIYHLILKHHERKNDRNAEIWNISVDVITRLLVKETFDKRITVKKSNLIDSKSSWKPEPTDRIPQILYDTTVAESYDLILEPFQSKLPELHNPPFRIPDEILLIIQNYAGIEDCCSTVVIMDQFRKELIHKENSQAKKQPQNDEKNEAGEEEKEGSQEKSSEKSKPKSGNDKGQTDSNKDNDEDSEGSEKNESNEKDENNISSNNSQQGNNNTENESQSIESNQSIDKLIETLEEGPDALEYSEEMTRFEGIVKNAYTHHYDKSQGYLPGSLIEFIEGMLNPVIPWNSILHRFLQNTLMVDWHWSRPNRRYVYRKIFLPSVVKENLEAVIAIDTSGSISSNELRDFLSEVLGIIQNIASTKIYLISCDASVQDVIELEHGVSIDNKILPWEEGGGLRGRGGTSFIPVFDYVRDKEIYPDVLIYFTDTYGTFPSSAPNYPVLWIKTTDGKIPWGEDIRYYPRCQ